MTRSIAVLATVLGAVLAVGLTTSTSAVAEFEPSRAADGPAPVFVELDRPAAVDAFGQARSGGQPIDEAVAAALDARRTIEQTILRLVDLLRGDGKAPTVLFRTTNAVPGVALLTDGADEELAKLPGVRSISRITPKRLTNSTAVQLTRTLDTWRQAGRLGDGIRIGVIDNGVDYTHADFGGPGTPEAFKEIDPTEVERRVFPTAKVVGGFDFAGDDYDASGEVGSPKPDPDPNPIPCADHGTHVAGTAAGFGLNADGSTFRGDYRTLTPQQLDAMRVGPGTAPLADIYAFKVFGCEGSTTLTSQALDAALDPDGDGDFSDRLDVVNLSLGTDYGAPDDPDARFIHKLAAEGVVPVVSVGNAGDLYDSGSAPGSAPEALTVGSSKDDYVLRDGVEVTAGAPPGPQPGQYSVSFDYAGYDKTRPVVTVDGPGNEDGCDPFSPAAAAAVADRFVWLQWSDDGAKRRCGSKVRADNAAAAGAAGVLIPADGPQFEAEIAGNAAVPMFQLTGPASRLLEPAVAAGGLVVRLAGILDLTVPTHDPALTDTVSEFSARGLRGPGVKPDVTAPGDSITSALYASGTGRTVIGGTSMASPHVAGIAALVREQHPDWPVADLKAAVVNTAGVAVHPDKQPTGPVLGPNRAGTGRVDAVSAVATEAVALGESLGGSVDFGTVDVTGPTELAKRITVHNKGPAEAVYTASYRPAVEMSGVSYAVSPSTVAVPPGQSRDVTVTLRVPDPDALRRTGDPTIERTPGGKARQFVADASGVVALASEVAGEPSLRVAVYSAPRPVAALTVPPTLRLGPGDAPADLPFAGRGLAQGEGSDAFRSRATVLTLAAESPELPPCVGVLQVRCTPNGTARAGDLRYVGVGSTISDAPSAAADGVVTFGFVTWGEWANLGSSVTPFVQIDTDRDGAPDFEVAATKLENSDVLVAETKSLRDKEAPTVATVPINGAYGDVDSNVYDTDVVALHVPLSTLGIAPLELSAPFEYVAGVAGYYTAPADETGIVDATQTQTFDPLNPPLRITGSNSPPSLGFAAQPGTTIQVADGSARPGREPKVLVLQHHNGQGSRAAVVPVTALPVSPAVLE